MSEFIMLMHKDTATEPTPDAWSAYFAFLSARGVFDGGSSIGAGEVFRKHSEPGKLAEHLTGYIRVRAESLAQASELLTGNPVFECGGSVEIRELPRD